MRTDAWTLAAAERPSTEDGHSRLLVPVDPSDGWPRAIPSAVAVAQRHGCPITLFGWHWDAAQADAMRWKLDMMAAELGVHRARGRRLHRRPQSGCPDLARGASGAGHHDLHGDPCPQPCRVRSARQHRRGDRRRTTEPVLLIGPHSRPDQHDPSGPVVASVDGSTFSEHIVPVAAQWATGLGLRFEVVGVVEPGAFEDLDVQRYRLDVLESGYLAHVAKRARSDASWEVLHGDDPAHALVDHARGPGVAAGDVHARPQRPRTGGRRQRCSPASSTTRRAPCWSSALGPALSSSAQLATAFDRGVSMAVAGLIPVHLPSSDTVMTAAPVTRSWARSRARASARSSG